MIRVVLPAHLRRLASIEGEVKLEVTGAVTQCSVLDALEARYPMLRGTIRDQERGGGRSSASSRARKTCPMRRRMRRCLPPLQAASSRT